MTGQPDRYRLTDATFAELVAHARSDVPYEVCGLVADLEDGTQRVWQIANDQRSITYYQMNGRELLRAMRTIEDDELPFAIYHSHTHTQAYPSATDIRLAAYPDATYLIVTLQDRDLPAVRAFSIIDGVVTEKAVEREDGTTSIGPPVYATKAA